MATKEEFDAHKQVHIDELKKYSELIESLQFENFTEAGQKGSFASATLVLTNSYTQLAQVMMRIKTKTDGFSSLFYDTNP